jgi:hypothetical protein
MTDTTSSLIGGGLTVLFYQWIYIPLCTGWGFTPWSLTAYGLVMLVIGLILAGKEVAIDVIKDKQ